MASVVYCRRPGVVSRREEEWRADDDALVVSAGGGRERKIAWKDIIGVRLYHEALSRRPWRYAIELHTRQGARIIIDNAHCCTRRDYENRSDSYTPFVRAVLAHIGAANPKARLLLGETQKRYFFLMLAALLTMCLLAYALIGVRTPLDATPYAAAVKFGVFLVALPLLWLGVLRVMPRGLPLDQCPERALPPTQPAEGS